MQYPFSCTPPTLDSIERTLSAPRLGRYIPAAGGDKNLALRFYVWNARLCEAMYLPSQIAEVASRNAIHGAVVHRYGENWNTSGAFLAILPDRFKEDVDRVTAEETLAHGSKATINHVVAGMPFGFWVHLLTTNYGNLLWNAGIRHAFPHAPKKTPTKDAHSKLDRLRRFRNRVAHHNVIFDKQPTAEYQNMLEIIGWVCPETLWLVKELSQVSQTINRRPQV